MPVNWGTPRAAWLISQRGPSECGLVMSIEADVVVRSIRVTAQEIASRRGLLPGTPSSAALLMSSFVPDGCACGRSTAQVTLRAKAWPAQAHANLE